MLSFHIIKEASLPSTSAALKTLAREGAPEGTVLIAEQQTAGYGRFERAFFSPRGTGLYMSLLLRPAFSPVYAPWMTVAAAVAVAEAIEAVSGRRAEIKWVNDIYLDGGKAAGILTESALSADGALAYAVLGIGVDVFPPEEGFPETLSQARAVFPSEFGHDRAAVRDALAEAILARFASLYAALPETPFLESYRRRSLLTGKRVRVFDALTDAERAETGREALVTGIGEDASLLVRYGDGTEAALRAGEVTLFL